MKTYFYLYQITNNVNGKIYVGVHKTKKLDDGYMGSGKVIKRAIAKYGRNNFTKIIMETFDFSKEMYAREKQVVTEEFLARDDVYNLRRGGFGGFDYINLTATREQKQNGGKAAVKKRKLNELNNPAQKEKRINKARLKALKNIKDGIHNGFCKEAIQKGLVAMNTETAKKKRKETLARIGHQQGIKNSQFGTMWITNEAESKKIKKDMPLPNGWRKGRI